MEEQMARDDVRSDGPGAGMFIAFILECVALMMICVVLWEIYAKISAPAEQALEVQASVTSSIPNGLNNAGYIGINDAQATSELYQSDDIDNSPYAAVECPLCQAGSGQLEKREPLLCK